MQRLSRSNILYACVLMVGILSQICMASGTVKISDLPADVSLVTTNWFPEITSLSSGTTKRAQIRDISTAIGLSSYVKSPYAGTLTVSALVASSATATSDVFTVSDSGYVTAVAYLGDGSNLSGVITNPAWQTLTLNAGEYSTYLTTPLATITTLNATWQPTVNAAHIIVDSRNGLPIRDIQFHTYASGGGNDMDLLTIKNSSDAKVMRLSTSTSQSPFIEMSLAGSPKLNLDGGGGTSWTKGNLAVATGNVDGGVVFTVNGAMSMNPASTPSLVIGAIFMDTTASHNVHVYDGSAWRVLQWN